MPPPFLYSSLIVTLSAVLSVESKVCKSLDVRNTPEHIAEFKHCRVIEGYLQVVLMELSDDVTDFFNNSFSELYEITEYLIVFRVMGLPSLDVIFPKLISIKGENLFMGYALVLYELQNLEQIGLTSLQSIGNGGVRIDNCPNLCYVDTINWNAIGISHLVYDRVSDCEQERCPRHCQGFCWSEHECQVFERSNCDPLCVGCTRNASPKHCLSCKYFNDSGTCVQKCPPSKLIDNEFSRCLTFHDCVARNSSVYKSICVEKCPDFYKRNSGGNCTRSNIKLCSGMEINSHFELEQMMGCTHINGSLDLVLYGYIDNHLLEKALGKVVNISGYLKIARSHPITTLAFFKQLEVIKGEKLWSSYYSLFVVENKNLQELFHKHVVIENGEALFQNNPHLCPSDIDTLKNVTTSSYNNGGYGCNITSFNVTVVENNSTNVTISWSLSRNVTVGGGYTVYYIKIQSDKFDEKHLKEVFFDKEGLPFEDAWNSVFVRNNSAVLKRLTPYTRYKYYIKTVFSPGEMNSQSSIYEIKTATGDPSEPVDLEAESQTDTSLTLKWKPPSYLNGNLSHYNLTVYRQEDFPLFGQRNYCIHPYVESNCSCSPKDEVMLFLQQGDTCIGPGDHYCNAKTIYHTEVPQVLKQITKRSINQSDDVIQEFVISSNRTTFVVYGLEPFTMYIVFMKACNRRDEEDTYICGGSIMTFQRTLKRRGVDFVTDVTIRVENKSVAVNWTKPTEFNSVILAYRVEYRKVGGKFSRTECRTSEEYERDLEMVLDGLEEGKYALRVGTVSLAGHGETSPWRYFEVYGGTEGTGRTRGSTTGWLYSVLGLLGMVGVLGLGFVIWRKYQEARSTDTRNLILEMSVNRDHEEDEWKLDDETVEIIKELGQNYVGILYRK